MFLKSLTLLLVLAALSQISARPDIRKVYTPPSFGSTTPRSYAVAAGGSPTTSTTTPTPPPRNKKPSSVTTTKATTPGPILPRNLTFVLAARDLPLKKKGSKIDPYIKVSHRTGTLQEIKDWAPVGQTEVLKGTNNPEFLSVFTFEWTKGKNQQLRFEVKGKHSLSSDENLGQVTVNVDDYVLQKKEDLSVKLVDPGAGGTLILRKAESVFFKLSARMIPKLDAFNGLSDPFVKCSWRKGKEGNDTLFHTTKEVEDTENPDWKEKIEFRNYQRSQNIWWHFEVYDSDNVSGNDYIGDVLMEVNPFVQKRATVNNNIGTKNSKDPKHKAVLIVTPA